jgi:chaperonin GroEL
MMEMGVIDPTKVVRAALQNAASIAALMITTEAMIATVPEQNSDVSTPSMEGGM